MLHVVVTRFALGQGSLFILNRARLLMFKYFCLASLSFQTTASFYWLILVDDSLHPSVRKDLDALVADYPMIEIVNISPPSSKTQEAPSSSPSSPLPFANNDELVVYVSHMLMQDPTNPFKGKGGGNYEYLPHLEKLYSQWNLQANPPSHLLLTMLDADDGLQRLYFHTLHTEALSTLFKTHDFKYQYFCSKTSLNWHFSLAKFGNFVID